MHMRVCVKFECQNGAGWSNGRNKSSFFFPFFFSAKSVSQNHGLAPVQTCNQVVIPIVNFIVRPVMSNLRLTPRFLGVGKKNFEKKLRNRWKIME